MEAPFPAQVIKTTTLNVMDLFRNLCWKFFLIVCSSNILVSPEHFNTFWRQTLLHILICLSITMAVHQAQI